IKINDPFGAPVTTIWVGSGPCALRQPNQLHPQRHIKAISAKTLNPDTHTWNWKHQPITQPRSRPLAATVHAGSRIADSVPSHVDIRGVDPVAPHGAVQVSRASTMQGSSAGNGPSNRAQCGSPVASTKEST